MAEVRISDLSKGDLSVPYSVRCGPLTVVDANWVGNMYYSDARDAIPRVDPDRFDEPDMETLERAACKTVNF